MDGMDTKKIEIDLVALGLGIAFLVAYHGLMIASFIVIINFVA